MLGKVKESQRTSSCSHSKMRPPWELIAKKKFLSVEYPPPPPKCTHPAHRWKCAQKQVGQRSQRNLSSSPSQMHPCNKRSKESKKFVLLTLQNAPRWGQVKTKTGKLKSHPSCKPKCAQVEDSKSEWRVVNKVKGEVKYSKAWWKQGKC